jgi:hypothetical protein
LSRSVIPESTQSAHSASLFEAHRDEYGCLASAGLGRELSGRTAVDLQAAISSTASISARERARAGSRLPVLTS